ncbi:hypothetical protein LIER_24791 [Lithospermum erythrorhizon]|uniref:Uncharacterized protein n=1 Tax=Lithospermum erythrorhizon TaxID=34254 RepID=A0AAV3R4N4_LITER
MPLQFYTDRRVLKAIGLSPIADADLGALEALRVSYSMPDSVPPPPPAAPVAFLNQLPPRYFPFPGITSFVDPLVASILTWATRHRPRPSLGDVSTPSLNDVAPKSPAMGTNTASIPEGHHSSSSPPLGQSQSPLPLAYQVPSAAPGDAGGQHSATVVLEPGDHDGVGFVTPQTPSLVPHQALECHPMSQATPPSRISSSPEEDGVSYCQSATITVPEEVGENTSSFVFYCF